MQENKVMSRVLTLQYESNQDTATYHMAGYNEGVKYDKIASTLYLKYHKHGKICWAKHSWFRPYNVFCGNTFEFLWPVVFIGASLSEPHHRRSTLKSVFLLA